MSLTRSAPITKLCLKNPGVIYTVVRNHWYKDYKAGPYPATEKERLAAAEKYGLEPSEYQTYPDDGTGFGDYPKLPDIGAETRDPFYPYDMPELKRNFNEPMHAHYDMFSEDRYNPSARYHLPEWMLWLQYFGVMGGTFAFYLWCEGFKFFPARFPKQLPAPDTVHYTFELKD